METIRQEHFSQAEIDACARTRSLSRELAPALMEHYMNCDHCASLVEEEQQLRRDFCTAAKLSLQGAQEKKEPAWGRISAFPVPALAAFALTAILLFGPAFQRTAAHVTTVELKAYRGSTNAAVSGRGPLVLKLDTTGLEVRGPVELRIVDATGRQVWHSKPRLSGGEWVDNINRRLARGVYWVRVMENGGSELLREYRLDIA